LRVQDPYKASYGVEDPEFAITQLAQTTMRSEIGKITLDTLFRERDNLNAAIVEAINQVKFLNGRNINFHLMNANNAN
jgi:regulator of protease activity HflC (stomatin/prohibitin superfamily)